MNEHTANAKYDHVFAIVRLDTRPGTTAFPDRELIAIKKVVHSLQTAEAEVKRLNELNVDKGCLYYWQTTRLERVAHPANAGEPINGTTSRSQRNDEAVRTISSDSASTTC